jgi:hypothetical protein
VGLLQWIERRRRWRREHIAAFDEVSLMQPDGLTLFQHQALHAISGLIPPEHFMRGIMDGEPGVYLKAPLGSDGFELFIYTNDAGIFGRKPYAWFEEWDYRTPGELLAALVKECTSRCASVQSQARPND